MPGAMAGRGTQRGIKTEVYACSQGFAKEVANSGDVRTRIQGDAPLHKGVHGTQRRLEGAGARVVLWEGCVFGIWKRIYLLGR